MIDLSFHRSTAFLTMNINKHNLLDIKSVEAMLNALLEIEEDSGLLAVVLNGNDSAFCAGADLEKISKYSKQELSDFFYLLDNLLYKIYTFPKPIIANITGHAIGGGLALSFATDYTIVSGSERSKFGFPEYKIGMSFTPTMLDLVSALNFSRYDIIILGRMIDAYEACKLGWFTERCDRDIESRINSIVREFLEISNSSFKFAKQTLKKKIEMPQRGVSLAYYSKLYVQLQEYLSKLERLR